MSDRDVAILRSLYNRIDQGDASAHNNLGVVFYQKGLLNEAFDAFERALEINPMMQVARRNAEIAFIESGKFDRRVRQYREVLRTDPTNADARDALARTYLLGGDAEGAAEEWTQLLAQHPGSTPLHMKLAYAEADRGREQDAIHLLEIAARLSPDLADVRLQLADLLLRLDMMDRAEEQARRAVSLDPDNARTHAFLGTLLRSAGRHEEADEILKRARELDPKALDSEEHLSLDRYRSARSARTQQKTSGITIARGALAAFARATELRQAGELQAAIVELEEALAEGKDTPEIRQALAEMHLLQGSAAASAEMYETLLAETDESPKLWNERGVALHRLGSMRDAIHAYRKAAALDPGYRLGWNNLGIALAQADETEAAERALQTAAEGEAPIEVYWNLGLFLALDGRPEDAVAAYQAAVDRDRSIAESWSRLGSALFQSRQPKASRDALLAALERDPALVEARYHLGFALSALGDYRGALRETHRALEQAPVLPTPSYLLLVDAQFEAGTIPAPDGGGEPLEPGATVAGFQFDPAALDELFVIQEEPAAPPGSERDAELELEAARLALRRGQLDKARRHMAPVVARHPGNPQVRLLEGEILLAQGLAGEALDRFAVVLDSEDLDPAQASRAREQQVRALLVLERATEAVEAARAVEEAGGPASLHGRALLVAGQPEAAVAAFERALAGGEKGSSWVTAYGQALLATGRLEEAERVFRLVVRREPSAVSQVGLARVLEARGDRQGALDAYRDAVRILPSYPPAVFELAELEWQGGRPGPAIRLLVDLLTLDPVNVEALVRLGIWLAQLGRWRASRRTLERALSLAPDDTDAQRQLSALAERER